MGGRAGTLDRRREVGPDLVFLAVTAHSLEGEMPSVAAVDQTTGTLRWEDELCDGCQVRPSPPPDPWCSS